MYARHNRQQGWTLLELILVLVCVAALTTVMVFSLMGAISQQQSVLRVSTQLNRLVDAAHSWRHQEISYQNLSSIQSLVDKGVIPDNLSTGPYRQFAFNVMNSDGGGSAQCVNNQCFAVSFNVPTRSARRYEDNLKATNPVLITDINASPSTTTVTVAYE